MAFLTPEEAGVADSPQYNSQKLSLDSFLTEMKAPREQFGPPEPERPAAQNMPGMEPDGTFEPPPLPGSAGAGQPEETHEQRRRKAKYTAKFVVSTIDTGVGNGCKLIAKAKSTKPYQATPEEKADMEDVWAEYLAEVGGDIPPVMLVLLVTSVVYTPKLIQAFSDKKLTQQLSDQEDEIKSLKEQIIKLKQEMDKKAA